MSQIQFAHLNKLLENKKYIIGNDEVGYGAISCEIVVGAVKAPKNWSIPGLNDSKKLSPKKREIMRGQLLKLVDEKVIQFHIAERSNKDIDKFGLVPMLKSCYVECFKHLYTDDSLIVCDGNLKFDNLGVDDFDKVSLIKADTLISSVMAASILAKTYRDEKMREYHKDYPQYNWIQNMGYFGHGNIHIDAIKKYGFSPLHRLSYKLKGLNGIFVPMNKE